MFYRFTIFKDFHPPQHQAACQSYCQWTHWILVWNTPRYIWSFVLGIVFLKDSLWLDPLKKPNQTTLLDQIQYSQWEKKLTGEIHHINVRVFDCLVPFHRKIGANATTYIPTSFFKLQESFKSHRCFLSEPFPVYGNPSWNLVSRA